MTADVKSPQKPIEKDGKASYFIIQSSYYCIWPGGNSFKSSCIWTAYVPFSRCRRLPSAMTRWKKYDRDAEKAHNFPFASPQPILSASSSSPRSVPCNSASRRWRYSSTRRQRLCWEAMKREKSGREPSAMKPRRRARWPPTRRPLTPGCSAFINKDNDRDNDSQRHSDVVGQT